MNGWVIFTIAMALPGFAEGYAAYVFFPYIRRRAGLIPFIFFSLSSIFDLGFSAIMTLILLLGGKLQIELDLSNIFIFCPAAFIVLAFYCWRAASGMIALWFAGKLQERAVRQLLRIDEELPN